MKLTRLVWYPYRIPFKSPFVTAHGSLSHRQGALVHLQSADGRTGLGEIAPLPAFGGRDLAHALDPLPALAHELAGRELGAILRWLAEQNDQLPAALVCGLETAVLDLLAQERELSLAALLCEGAALGPRQSIAVNAVLGGATIPQVLEQARTALAAGFNCLKLKVVGEEQSVLERVAAVRSALGPTPRLRLDANAAWQLAEATRILAHCAPYDIEYIEQPLPADDLAGMARLRRSSPIPLAADEALYSQASIRRVLDAEAADVLILKLQIGGSLSACRSLIQEASRRSVTCVLTSTLETGTGIAATLHLAAATPEITLACGLATLDLLEHDLLQEKLTPQGGMLAVPTAPGLGISLDLPALAHYLEGSPCYIRSRFPTG